jgi:predicted DNA-binding WGR domain protein
MCYAIEVKDGRRVIERIKFKSREDALDAYDELERKYSRRGYIINFIG